jgi:hypothetical protein
MSIIETGILVALIAIAAIGILTVFGSTVSETLHLSTLKFKAFEPFGVSSAEPENNIGITPEVLPGEGGKDYDVDKVSYGDGDNITPVDPGDPGGGSPGDITGDDPIASANDPVDPGDPGGGGGSNDASGGDPIASGSDPADLGDSGSFDPPSTVGQTPD